MTASPEPRGPRGARRRWRAAVVLFLVVVLGGAGVVTANALWSQSGTLQATVTTGSWGSGGGSDDGSGDGGGSTTPVTDGTQPVDLDPRLSFTPTSARPLNTRTTSLGFCYDFTVTNVSAESVAWSVTFDTAKPLLWGLDPTAPYRGVGSGTLSSLSGGQTASFDPATHHWTIAGLHWNRTLAPGASANVGYCAEPAVPAVDPQRYHAPRVSIDPSSHKHSVALRVTVTADTDYYVPWSVEVDLAEYVCASTLPQVVRSEQGQLTRIEGTRYLLQGTGSTRFVASYMPQDFVFTRYNPGGQAFTPGTCP